MTVVPHRKGKIRKVMQEVMNIYNCARRLFSTISACLRSSVDVKDIVSMQVNIFALANERSHARFVAACSHENWIMAIPQRISSGQ